MWYKDSQGQSLVDYLIKRIPGLDITFKMKKSVDPLAAKTLFSIWKDESNKINANLYKRPSNIAANQLDAMSKAGLTRIVGNNIEITDKGANIIRVMVLGDDSSIYDRSDDKIIDYTIALANTKKVSASKNGKGISKHASDNWWKRFL